MLKLAKRPVTIAGSEETVMKPMLVWEIGGDVGIPLARVLLLERRRNDRLTDDPTFILRYRSQSRTGRAPSLAHELHIKVLKPPEVEQLREPLCPDPDVRRNLPPVPFRSSSLTRKTLSCSQIHILLPPLSLLKTITAHLQSLSSHLQVSASAEGVFRIVAGRGESRGVEVATEWKGLKVPKGSSYFSLSFSSLHLITDLGFAGSCSDGPTDLVGGRSPVSEEPSLPDQHLAQVAIALPDGPYDPRVHHRLCVPSLLALGARVWDVDGVYMRVLSGSGICEHHSLILYLYIGDVEHAGGVLTFFIPAVVVDDDD